MRYPHIIRKSGGGKWPARIVCVDAVPVRLGNEHGKGLEAAQLSNWCSVSLVRAGQQYRVESESAGCTMRGWWTLLGELSDSPGNTWTVSHDCLSVWSLLGLWEELEDGRIILADNPRDKDAKIRDRVLSVRRKSNDALGTIHGSDVRRLLSDGTGYLVTEGPPCIARIRLYRMRRWLTWVDVRNYGVECPASIMPGRKTVNWIAESIQQISVALSEFTFGCLCATVGSQALRGFRHGYLDARIYCHAKEEVLTFERSANYGGRCECSMLGDCVTPLWHLDYKAMYTSICRDVEVPVRLVLYNESCGDGDCPSRQAGFGVIAEVDIETNEPAYPKRREHDTIYPVGRFTTVLAWPELEDALTHGRVRRYRRLAVYEMEPALHEYAKACLQLRHEAECKGHAGIIRFAKALGNSLPGKFGQRSRRWVPCDYQDIHPLYGEWWGCGDGGEPCRYRSIAGTVLRDEDQGFSEDSVPAIAAWITSIGRMKLLEAIRLAGWDHTYYVDTDALMVDVTGYDKLRAEPGRLEGAAGTLQCIHKGCTVSFAGPKQYAIKSGTDYDGTGNAPISVCGRSASSYVVRTVVDSIQQGVRPGRSRRTVTVQKPIDYHLGRVGQEGRVVPWILEEW